MRLPVAVWLGLLGLLATGFFCLPGRTYLQSDTQIYVPILERLYDPTLFANEIIARQPHVAFTIYDEVTLALRKVAGSGIQAALTAQQLVFRLCGLLGVFLLASAMGFSWAPALLVTSFYGLGATISGPAVLTIEYEPVPRTCAMGLTLLAMGLGARGWFLGSGVSAALGLLYHAPAVYPYWGACLLLAILPLGAPSDRFAFRRRLLPMAAGILGIVLLSQWQASEGEKQQFWTRLEPAQAAVMHERAAYNWISLWNGSQPQQYALFFCIAAAALWRLRGQTPAHVRALLLLASGFGLLSMPASYLLLEGMQWSLMPQIQPMRALLYVTLSMVIAAAAAGVAAASQQQWREAGLWFFAALAPSVQTRTVWALLFEPDFRRPLGAAILIAASALAALWVARRWRRQTPILAASLLLAPMTLAVSGVRNYPQLHHPELDALAGWARAHTPVDAVFFFPEAGRGLHPGVFRAKALRAVYVDWKGGGQINFLREFLPLWLPRWREVGEPALSPKQWERYQARGIAFVILPAQRAEAPSDPVYRNRQWAVYPVSASPKAK